MPRPATELFLDLISRRSSAYEKAFRSESADTTALEDEAAGLLRKAAGDEDLSTAAAGLLSLGALGRKDDAFFLAGFLSHDNTGIREAAAQALGRMGPGAREAVEKALSSEPERTRILGCKAAARSWDAATLRSLARCLDDRSGAVRSAGVAAMASVEGVMSSEKKAFRPRLQELAASDPSPGLRAAAACAAANIP